MWTATTSRRVLITAPFLQHQRMEELFRDGSLANWETIFTSEVDEARFFMQHSPVDAWLFHEDAANGRVGQCVDRLVRANVPTLYVCKSEAESILPAFHSGALSWLPTPLVWEHPKLLAAALRQAARTKRVQRRASVSERKWRRCRRHVDRLVHLIWRTTPAAPPLEWFPQRFAMERLQEEVARANRFGEPLSVAIGEIRVDEGHQNAHVTEWMPKVIGSLKRRCDVIGQYGMNGFLLVMVHTPKTGAIACCQRLRAALEQSNRSNETEKLHAYFGVAEAGKESTPQQLLRQAEENLNAAVCGRGSKQGDTIAKRGRESFSPNP